MDKKTTLSTVGDKYSTNGNITNEVFSIATTTSFSLFHLQVKNAFEAKRRERKREG